MPIKNQHHSQNQTPVKVFVSYSPADEVHKVALGKHLSMLKRQGIIASFDAGKILGGEEWNALIQQHLNEAAIILLLLSADALANDYIHDTEIQQALKRAENKEAVIIPILLRSVAYTGLGVEKYMVLPSNGKPVTEWKHPDKAYEHIAQQIAKVVEHLDALKNGDRKAFKQILQVNTKQTRYKVNQAVVIGLLILVTFGIFGFIFQDKWQTDVSHTTENVAKASIKGMVVDSATSVGLPQVKVIIDYEHITYTDEEGRFNYVMPLESSSDRYQLSISKTAYETEKRPYYSNANKVEIPIKKTVTQ